MADHAVRSRERQGQAAAYRAQLNEQLGFYPANLDEESVAEYRRKDAEERERLARWKRKYDGPLGSRYNQFRHLGRGNALEPGENELRNALVDCRIR
jgi:hypothetical protein